MVSLSGVGAEAASDTKSSSAVVPPGCSFELSAKKIDGRAAPWAALPASIATTVQAQMSRRNGRMVRVMLEAGVVQVLSREPGEARDESCRLLARQPGCDELGHRRDRVRLLGP